MFSNKPIKLLYLIGICLLFFNVSCPDRNIDTAYKPLFMDRTDLENSIKFEAAKNLEKPAKIYTKDGYIFISETYKGIHVINNADPKNPVNIGFLNVVGCLDMAVKNNTIYVDNATDLVAIDISDPTKPIVSSRVRDVFPDPVPPDLLSIPSQFLKENRPANLVLVSWVKK